jgi:hypothetical protein
MTDGRFSDKGAHFAKWVLIINDILKLAFAGDGHKAKCCAIGVRIEGCCLSMRFMSNYLVWHQHGEVQPPTTDELNINNDDDQMNDIIADIGTEYDLGSGDQHLPPEVQNFYRLITASDEKVHDGTDVTVLQVVTCLSPSDEIDVQLLKSMLEQYHEIDY